MYPMINKHFTRRSIIVSYAYLPRLVFPRTVDSMSVWFLLRTTRFADVACHLVTEFKIFILWEGKGTSPFPGTPMFELTLCNLYSPRLGRSLRLRTTPNRSSRSLPSNSHPSWHLPKTCTMHRSGRVHSLFNLQWFGKLPVLLLLLDTYKTKTVGVHRAKDFPETYSQIQYETNTTITPKPDKPSLFSCLNLHSSGFRCRCCFPKVLGRVISAWPRTTRTLSNCLTRHTLEG